MFTDVFQLSTTLLGSNEERHLKELKSLDELDSIKLETASKFDDFQLIITTTPYSELYMYVPQ